MIESIAMGGERAMRGARARRSSAVRSAADAVQRRRRFRALLAFFLALPLAVAGVLLGYVAPSHASPFDLSGGDWEGCSELVRLARAELGASRVVATTQLDFHELGPGDGLILLYPERTLDVEQLAKFMHAGGRVILLDDYGRGESLLRHFNMSRVASPRHPAESLRKNPALALAEPASAHPVVSDVQRVVTNHPTGLSHPDLSPVLKIRSADGEPDVFVAVAGAVDRGRLLAVGDPSIVMNSMLRYAGNKAFARGLVRYAVDDDTWGKRGGRLFIASGAFTQKGSFGEDEDGFDQSLDALRDAVDSIRHDGLPPALAYALAIALGLALVVWVGSRAGRLHRPVVPRFVRGVPKVAQGGVAGHAAVIGAPQTSRVLAVLELKSALEEQLTALLGLGRVPAQQELLAHVAARGLLDAEGVHTLRNLLLRMSNAETMVVSQRSGGTVQAIRDAEVVGMARSVRQILDAAETNAQHGPARGRAAGAPRDDGRDGATGAADRGDGARA
jgi:hypothetical protein